MLRNRLTSLKNLCDVFAFLQSPFGKNLQRGDNVAIIMALSAVMIFTGYQMLDKQTRTLDLAVRAKNTTIYTDINRAAIRMFQNYLLKETIGVTTGCVLTGTAPGSSTYGLVYGYDSNHDGIDEAPGADKFPITIRLCDPRKMASTSAEYSPSGEISTTCATTSVKIEKDSCALQNGTMVVTASVEVSIVGVGDRAQKITQQAKIQIPAKQSVQLSPGCEGGGQRIFVSDLVTIGSIGDIDGADTICDNYTTGDGRPGKFRALLSTSSLDAKDHILIPSDGRICTIDNRTVAMGASQFWNNYHRAEITDKDGAAIVDRIFTGTYTGGVKPPAPGGPGICSGATDCTCGDWNDSAKRSVVGSAASLGNWLMLNGRPGNSDQTHPSISNDCSGTFRIYCVEVFDVP